MSWYADNPFSTCDLVFVVTTVFSVSHGCVMYGLVLLLDAVAYRIILADMFHFISFRFCGAIGDMAVAEHVAHACGYLLGPSGLVGYSNDVRNPGLLVTFSQWPFSGTQVLALLLLFAGDEG